MVKGGRRRAQVFFVALGAAVVALAIALNIGWVLLNWRTGLMLGLGVIFFVMIITGVVLNTIFLVREIRRNEQHDAFINAVTHELKTPVASMRLYLQTLQTREVSEERRREFYDIMLADSDRLMSTIEQVLRAARTSSSRPALQASINFSELVHECAETARRRHRLPEEQLVFRDFTHGAREVTGDPEELKAAVSNLLDNAVHYSSGSPRVEVFVTDAGPQAVAVRVRDSGIGLPASELKRIFKRFYRVPSAMPMRLKGTGLGLFIVRGVAERHGGRVWAESEGPGHGSVFTLELPSARALPASQRELPA